MALHITIKADKKNLNYILENNNVFDFLYTLILNIRYL